MQENLLTAEQVAVRIGCSYKTLSNWYAFKRANPESEYAKCLPDYIQVGPRQKRLWREEDIPALLDFKGLVPRGRNGVLGSVTQKWYHKKKGELNE